MSWLCSSSCSLYLISWCGASRDAPALLPLGSKPALHPWHVKSPLCPSARGSCTPAWPWDTSLLRIHSPGLGVIIPRVISPSAALGDGSGSTRYLTICWTNQFLQLHCAGCTEGRTAWASPAPHNPHRPSFPCRELSWGFVSPLEQLPGQQGSPLWHSSAALTPRWSVLQTVDLALESSRSWSWLKLLSPHLNHSSSVTAFSADPSAHNFCSAKGVFTAGKEKKKTTYFE